MKIKKNKKAEAVFKESHVMKLFNELAEIKKELKKIDKNKVSAEKFNLLEKRVIKLERKLEKYKVITRRKQQVKQVKKQRVK